MNQTTDSELSASIKDVIIQVLNLEPGRQLDDQASLYSSSVQMDSLTLLQLLVAVEERFGVAIDDEDVMNAELTDLGSLVAMIRDVVTGADGDK